MKNIPQTCEQFASHFALFNPFRQISSTSRLRPIAVALIRIVALSVATLSGVASAAAMDASTALRASQSTAPEFQSDTLLRIIARQRIEQGTNWPFDRSAAIADIEKAYSLGFRVKAQVPSRPVVSASEESFVRWMAAPLDRLSLQMRAAAEMVAVDPVRATVMLAREEKMQPAVAACGVGEFEDYGKMYVVADRLLQAQFTPDPKFVLDRLNNAKSPSSLAPILRMATSKRFTSQGYTSIVNASGAAFLRLKRNDQAFSATLGELAHAVGALRQKLVTVGVDDKALTQAYAIFLTKSITAARCSENLSGVALEMQNSVVESSRAALGLTIPPAAAQRDRPTPAPTAAEALLTQGMQATAAITGAEDGTGRLVGSELKSKIDNFLNAADAAANLPEDANSSVYKARVAALSAYLDFAPVGAQRSNASQTLLALISNSSLYTTKPVDWFLGVKRLLIGMDNWPDRDAQLQLLSSSANPVLQTYALLAMQNMIDQEELIVP